MDFSIEQIEQYSQINDISLCYGASGICLLLSEIDKEKAVSVFNVLKQKTLTLHGNINIRNGLAGVALLVKCLHDKGVFNGKISSVLREIDDTIFRAITNNNALSQLTIQDAIEVLYYLVITTKREEHINLETNELKFELIRILVDKIFEDITTEELADTYIYRIDHLLPQILIVLSQVLNLGIYKTRICQLLKLLEPLILYKMPILHSNRLYILVAISKIIESCKLLDTWNEYRQMLVENISIKKIIKVECQDLVYFENGLSSIYLLFREIPEYKSNIKRIGTIISKNIDNSTELKRLRENENYRKNHVGLFNGICGIELVLMLIKKDLTYGIKEDNRINYINFI